MSKLIQTQSAKRAEMDSMIDATIQALDQLETLCVIEFARANLIHVEIEAVR